MINFLPGRYKLLDVCPIDHTAFAVLYILHVEDTDGHCCHVYFRCSIPLTRWRYWWELLSCLFQMFYTTYTLEILMGIVAMSISAVLYHLHVEDTDGNCCHVYFRCSIPLTRWRYWWELLSCLFQMFYTTYTLKILMGIVVMSISDISSTQETHIFIAYLVQVKRL